MLKWLRKLIFGEPDRRIAISIRKATMEGEEVTIQTSIPQDTPIGLVYGTVARLGASASKRTYELNGDVVMEADWERALTREEQTAIGGGADLDDNTVKAIYQRLLKKAAQEAALARAEADASSVEAETAKAQLKLVKEAGQIPTGAKTNGTQANQHPS